MPRHLTVRVLTHHPQQCLSTVTVFHQNGHSIYIVIIKHLLINIVLRESLLGQKIQRLEDLRIDNDKTQAEIAEYLGCQREVYRRYEKGTRQLPVDFLIKLSDLYNVSTDYLLGLTNIKKPYPRNK